MVRHQLRTEHASEVQQLRNEHVAEVHTMRREQEEKIHQILCQHDAEIQQIHSETNACGSQYREDVTRKGGRVSHGGDGGPHLVERLKTDLERLEAERDQLRNRIAMLLINCHLIYEMSNVGYLKNNFNATRVTLFELTINDLYCIKIPFKLVKLLLLHRPGIRSLFKDCSKGWSILCRSG